MRNIVVLPPFVVLAMVYIPLNIERYKLFEMKFFNHTNDVLGRAPIQAKVRYACKLSGNQKHVKHINLLSNSIFFFLFGICLPQYLYTCTFEHRYGFWVGIGII